MTAAPKLIRAFLAAAVCIAAFAVWTPTSFGQVVDPAPTTGGDSGASAEPPAPPVDPPVVVDPPPDPPVVPDPPADPSVVVDPPPPDPPVLVEETPPVESQPADRSVPRAETDSRWETARGPAEVVTQTPASATPASTPISSDVYAVPAQLPPASAGEDWTWTDKGDAFIFGSGGSGGGDATAVLGYLSHYGSIATAAVSVPTLGAREGAARRAAQAGTSGEGLVLMDSSGNTMLFFKLFGGGGGGGAALVLLTAFGLLTVVRMMPPDWTRAFRNSTAVWRPSAYIPPIDRPG